MTESALAAPRHTAVEDALAIATGAFLVSLGVFLLESAGAVTGGLPGLALLLGRVAPLPFAAIYLAVSMPFLVLAAVRFGAAFTARSVVAVAAVAGLSLLHPLAFEVDAVSLAYGALAGNLAVGVGLLVLFRHRTSLGGFGVVALLAQERLGWRAGWVQLALDAAVVLSAAFVAPVRTVLVSLAGAGLLNVVIALNHRPGRYLA